MPRSSLADTSSPVVDLYRKILVADPETQSRLVRSLSELCRRRVTEEKWIFAPSLRVGQQWLDAVARGGQPVLNARVMTFKHLALELAAPEMTRRGASFLSSRQAELLIGRLFSRLKDGRRGYLWQLSPGPGLIQTLRRTLEDLRFAGVGISQLEHEIFEVPLKGSEIQLLLSEYLVALKHEKLLDYAHVLGIARERVVQDPSALPPEVRLVMAEDLGLSPLEGSLWEALPEQRRRLVPVDPPSNETDARRLCWFVHPERALSPLSDGTAQMFRAVGEINETREVLRRCVAEGIALDEVEVLYTDTDLYSALFFENAATFLSGELDAPAVTFAEGVPARYSRAGRALRAWINWIQHDCSQQLFVRLLQDGLLRVPQQVSSQRLAMVFASLPVARGRQRYLSVVASQLKSVEHRLAQGKLSADERKKEERGLIDLEILQQLISEMLELTPEWHADELKILQGVHRFLEQFAPSASRLDEYSRRKLLREVEDFIRCLEKEDRGTGLNMWEWLEDLAAKVRVGGQGPRPGCLHVASLSSGGHTGRPYTFIVGLDDGKFPGAGRQDPILLDRERQKISRDLPTSTGLMNRKIEGLVNLLARLRGRVTLSYSCRNLAEDREQFPSSFLLAAYRLLTGDERGDSDALFVYLGDPVSFVPSAQECCVDLAEWWLWLLCHKGEVLNPDRLIAQTYPTLGRGLHAVRERASSRFTKYDGYVPEAGKDFDPTAEQGPVLSASQLEKMGSSPLEFFLQYLLGLAPPETMASDPDVWLDPLRRGLFLHDLFFEFMHQLQQRGEHPSMDLHQLRILAMVEDQASRLRGWLPPPNSVVYKREVREIQRVALIFLREEERLCQVNEPYCMEVAVGLASVGEGTTLDTEQPCAVALPGGGRVRFRGRIDRLDRVLGPGTPRFMVWDYKTGSARKYHPHQPFQQGRVVQNVIYLVMAEERLRAVLAQDATVLSFGYFFPSTQEYGLRLAWSAAQLSEGRRILECLCQLIRTGCFPPSDEPEDLKYSPYQAVYGYTSEMSQHLREKIDNLDNVILAPLRELRRGESNHGE